MGGTCVAGLAAAIVVGVTLCTATTNPARWGVTYDHLLGNPYAPAPLDIITPIAGDADLTAVTAATVESIPINGKDRGVACCWRYGHGQRRR